MDVTGYNPDNRLYPDRYSVWAGNERGVKPKYWRCAEAVYPKGGWVSRQCTRSRGYGPDGAYCKQHARRHEKQT